MAIQTQRFTPLKHRHHKLATTQDELDEDLRRKMALQRDSDNTRVALANMREQNANNRANANLRLSREKMAEDQKQQGVTNQLNLRTADRQDANLKMAQEGLAYGKEQDRIKQGRQKKLDVRQEKLDSQDDYTFKRQQAEDRRVDAQRQEKKKNVDRVLAFGGLGSFIDRETRDGRIDENGYIDVSEMKDALGVLVNGYEYRGAPKVLVGNDGYVTFYDDDGAIKNNGNPVRIHTQRLMGAAPLARKYRQQQMGIKAASGNTQALKDARKDYEREREQADKLRLEYLKFQIDNPPPERPGEGADEKDIAAYNQEAKIHNSFTDRINQHEEDASMFRGMYEGRNERGLTLTPTKPKADKKAAKEKLPKEKIAVPRRSGLTKPTKASNTETPVYVSSKDPEEVLNGLRYHEKLTQEDERNLQKAAAQGQEAFKDRIMRLRNRIVNFGY